VRGWTVLNWLGHSAPSSEPLGLIKGWESVVQMFHTAINHVRHLHVSIITVLCILIPTSFAFYPLSTRGNFVLGKAAGNEGICT
jgi:hypothetical protein